jgi:hypothetical protein
MEPSGLHLLLTYLCNLECDHCFVWGSPWQSGTMTLGTIRQILEQAEDSGTIKWCYFEGGEPFLYYAVLLRGVREAASMGFQVGIVSDGYWATDVEDALEWLRPFAGLIQHLSISSDRYHWSDTGSPQAKNATGAAEQLGIPPSGGHQHRPAWCDRCRFCSRSAPGGRDGGDVSRAGCRNARSRSQTAALGPVHRMSA